MSRVNFMREMRDRTNKSNQTKFNNMNLKREQGWNDRFILGKMQDYCPKKQSK